MNEDEVLLPRQQRAENVKLYMYYLIIGLVSLVALVFLPMVGSQIGLDWNIPDTPTGWIVWAAVKIIVAVINVLIFHSFMQQARVNVRDNEDFKKANEILGRVKHKEFIPRSPHKFNTQTYGRKGTTIFITSALATLALSQAILTFDWMAMLTYLFTIIMGVVFGVLQMKSSEEYWTLEYPRYARMVLENEEAERAKAERPIEEANMARIDGTADVHDICDSVDSVLPTGDNTGYTGTVRNDADVEDNNSVCSVLGATDNTGTVDSSNSNDEHKKINKQQEGEEEC